MSRTALAAGSRLVHAKSGTVICSRLLVPRSIVGRGLGLMFRRTLQSDAGMWLQPCNGIHMFFMNFPIDAVFLDKAMRVVRVRAGLKPWRVIPLVFRANSCLELPSGRLEDLGLSLACGDQLRLES